MDNHIISILQNFEKPHEEFLKDKECLICLELLDDLEYNKFVQFPCKCSNSVYHIDCIVKLLRSGANKNFCPHCKTYYEIYLQQQQQIQILGNQIVQDNQQEIHDPQIKYFTHILVFHILSNSLMNVINIVASRNWVENNGNETFQVLILFYFCKLFLNYVILMYSKNNIDKIEDCLVYSYIFQTMLLCLLIYVLTKTKNDTNSTILIVNNVLFSFGDLTFRIIIEYKMRNTVNIL